MKTRPSLPAKPPSLKTAWFVLIVALATTAGMICDWRAPGFDRYAQDSLMRARGTLPAPDDIVIVAIDEPSIARLGQFPWERDLTAQILNTISPAQPKAIALDVLYAEPTEPEDDQALTEAVKQAGNVVLGEQLIETKISLTETHSSWLGLVPEIKNAAAGTGHVHVPTEQDGTARELMLRLADDEGSSRWALAVETIRVGDRLEQEELVETDESVRVGQRRIPFTSTEKYFPLKLNDTSGMFTAIQPLRLTIDYIGPTGSFSPQTYSFADVLEGRISPERFRGKYVLIGATAAALGDRIATPFVHVENDADSRNGELMPGVEILANTINTILRSRFYQPVSDWTAGFFAALAAFAVLLLTRLAEGRFEAAKQIALLSGLGLLILLGCYLVYFYFLVIPPVVPMIVSFAAAAPLALLRRSLAASAGIDARISELKNIQESILTNGSRRFEDFNDEFAGYNRETGDSIKRKFFPRGLESKTRTLGYLSRNLIERSLFIDRSLRALDEGLLIAAPDGSITFSNPRAAKILNLSEQRLIGSSLFTRIFEAETNPGSAANFSAETIVRQLIERGGINREIVIGDSAHYLLRLSGVTFSDEESNEILGIVATLSDITEHHELQQIKNDVITLVTHELRTPLTAIQGMSEVLTEHEVDPEVRRKMLATINDESKRLARMINEYLDITRLESGIQKAHFSSVNVTDLVERALLILDSLAAKKDIKITRIFELGLPVISADSGMLAQAMTNIVGNAVKYSPSQTEITVEIQTNRNTLQISVMDEGYGISPEQLPHIFEKFYRVPHRQNVEVSGTGLGLSLTREIVELHGGYITVESEPNAGSTFTIYLPCNSADSIKFAQ
jgi:signal transduction histidine kinase/CHASE2 domain-containing sensor protein